MQRGLTMALCRQDGPWQQRCLEVCAFSVSVSLRWECGASVLPSLLVEHVAVLLCAGGTG